MPYRILIYIIQTDEIGLLIGKSRLPEIVPHLTTRCFVEPINPTGGLGVKRV